MFAEYILIKKYKEYARILNYPQIKRLNKKMLGRKLRKF